MTAAGPDVGARPGQYVGTDNDPDTYRLEEYVGRGGEGEVWRASEARADGRTRSNWAVKVMRAADLQHRDDVSPLAELEDRYDRHRRSKRETDQLIMAVRGVVGATDVFQGGEPHAPGVEPEHRVLYVASPWVEGQDLATWRPTGPSFDEMCDVVEGLARIVDQMAAHAQNVVHRDISPGNVIRADGEVKLIDFTFVRPPNSSAGTVAVHNGGYTAPEVYLRGPVGVAADRYSVGAVTHFLLVGAPPPTERTQAHCREVLLRRGFSSELAEHVVAMLDTDPARRPDPLLDWARTLRQLGQVRTGVSRRVEVDLVTDGSGSAVVVTAGEAGLAMARLAPGMPRALVPVPAGPAMLCSVAAATDGSGGPVAVAVDDSGCLWSYRRQRWDAIGTARPDAGVAVTRLPSGGVVGYAVDPAEPRLVAHTLELDAAPRSHRPAYAGRVLAAGNHADGSPVVVAVAPAGGLVCIDEQSTTVVTERDAVAADVCVDVWGELLCVYVPAGSGTAEYVEQLSGRWSRPVPLAVPGAVVDVACVGTRSGVTIAVAGSAGLHLANVDDTGLSAWRTLTDRPSEQVGLDVGAAWLLQLAAVGDEQVMASAEEFGGS